MSKSVETAAPPAAHTANGAHPHGHSHGPLAHHFETLPQQREACTLGMWMFLATELLVFGALFAAYTVYRTIHWREFEVASSKLNLYIGFWNTVVLLTSSWTMVMAIHHAEHNEHKTMSLYMVLTAALGGVFLIVKGFEYYGDYVENLVPVLAFDNAEWSNTVFEGEPLVPQYVTLFLLLYYIMTMLHAIHLIVGIVVMLVLAAYAYRGAFPKENFIPVEVWGLYWHFVDLVWIFLLPLLYLVGTRVGHPH